MAMLKRIDIMGYRSIKNASVEFRALNVLIGANGAGKSNFVSFFKMLNEMMGAHLQQYIGTTGRAKSILHFGPKVTPQVEAHLEFETDQVTDWYDLRLFHATGDTLVFAEETLRFQKTGYATPAIYDLGSGHQETRITDEVNRGNQTAKVFRHLLNQCRVYHFHDTSPTARSRD
jgi:predicted ATPase